MNSDNYAECTEIILSFIFVNIKKIVNFYYLVFKRYNNYIDNFTERDCFILKKEKTNEWNWGKIIFYNDTFATCIAIF